MSVRVGVSDLVVDLGGNEILHGVDFEVEPGEFITLLGPSGSGKTTTLNVVAGFVKQRVGQISFDGQVMDDRPPRARGVGFVFQNYALFPHMTVAENIGFPLRARKVGKDERRKLVEEVLDLVDLRDMGKRRVRSLSGGQQQRVAVARALVFRPRLLLLDEPLAALDKGLRETMQVELKRIQHEVGVTTIAVTHDQTEALTMSDRVGIMRDGLLEQLDRPEVLYQEPRTLFAARFLGEANLFPVDASGNVGALGIRVEGGPGFALVRPEDLAIREKRDQDGVRAVVQQLDFQGVRYRLQARVGARGASVVVSAPVGAQVSAAVGGEVKLVVSDPERVHVIEEAPGTQTSPEAQAAPLDPGAGRVADRSAETVRAAG